MQSRRVPEGEEGAGFEWVEGILDAVEACIDTAKENEKHRTLSEVRVHDRLQVPFHADYHEDEDVRVLMKYLLTRTRRHVSYPSHVWCLTSMLFVLTSPILCPHFCRDYKKR